MNSIFLFAVAVLTPSALGLECPFDCFNNSTCAEGNAEFSDHPLKQNGDALDIHGEVTRDGKHCSCLPGFTGLRCGRKYESCSDKDHKCYHGGKCIMGLADIYGNDHLYCDCSQAIDEHGVQYVGKYCEIPATQSCDNSSDFFFCVNGGYCKNDYLDSPQRPCRCGADHDGAHCEFDKGSVPDCTLSCQNGGHCKLGIPKNMPGHDQYLLSFFKDHMEYQYCDCPTGFYGPQCETHGKPCGDHQCFHGANCVQTRVPGGNTLSNCDCTTASTQQHSYGGQFCQYESTHFCDKTKTPNGQQFCVNGGTCKENNSLGCDCPDGFHGPICEFQDAPVPAPFEECKLQCSNGGQCRKGVKDMSFLDKFGPELEQFNISHSRDFEHCACPDGWTGLKCEHQIEVCGENEHACFHGSKCVVANGDRHTCDCDNGFDAFEKLAGRFCEHKATTICTRSGNAALETENFAFCVNNGKCKDIIDENGKQYPGCECPDSFSGPHCEFLQSALSEEQERTTSESQNSSLGAPTNSSGSGLELSELFGIAVALFVVVGILSLLIVELRSRARSQKVADNLEEASHESLDFQRQDSFVLDMNGFAEEGEMQNIAII
eukprot:CAMPEP_0202455188 /NCGR_PEP_ID=MMETSP1360-20130828/12780_1 /ASSEMBLY_ACC=CAM_ASM_000848 /TAXON_ID=515479 /ORGANISM="Licmophora paradoxa, Strain CCMP2313" /LENGTH=602 /DNA_ID=CAMNT_0049074709 /DNA_START=80 /DNA_END=1888 /DNA_ORIENTATION=+